MTEETKRCPDCAEIILAAARKCKHCGFEFFSTPSVKSHAPSIAPPDLSEVLESLIDRSLVVFDGNARRYRLLETVRQYALDRLMESGEANGRRDLHTDHFLQISEVACAGLRGAEQGHLLELLDIEADNFRAALSWSLVDRNHAGRLARLSGSLTWYWHLRSRGEEGLRWAQLAIDRAEALDIEERAKLYYRTAVMEHSQTKLDGAHDNYTTSLALFEQIGNKIHAGWAQGNLAALSLEQNKPDQALSLAEVALATMRCEGIKDGMAAVLYVHGEAALAMGDPARARLSLEESLALSEELGDSYAIARIYGSLGNLFKVEGDAVASRDYHAKCLRISLSIGQKGLVSATLDELAARECSAGEYERAYTIFAAAQSVRESAGLSLLPVNRADYERSFGQALNAIQDESVAKTIWSIGSQMSMSEAVDYALGSDC
jgi:tetratricopeptide (TPR) repeat protein